ncbi:MAG: xanthine dehydrogenase family protein subunit M [Clostridia bacterium]|jgi:carbon-monoxide dehydrogenase medium subunit|nr:xanthine dehydrogenase family protein subunit M [Clostridia bacterium]MDH7572965.1 xanthine dehydrogenase family protein subunit M [Clostridia bacterium]
MYLPDFDYFAPMSLAEACALLARFGSSAKALAAGTDLLPKMKGGLLSPEVLVSLRNLEGLRGIQYHKERGVVIGALVTHNDLIRSALLQEKYPSVCGAARQIANYQIRNRGTVGGNICNAVPSADLPPILIALEAQARLVGATGERTLPLEQFFVGPNQTVINQDEILTEIVIPDREPPFTGSTYLKFGLRRSGALAVVGVAAAVVTEGNVVKEARIVLGAVAPVPMRAKKAEELLTGKEATEELLEEVGRCAAAESKPISDIRASEEYRRDMVRVFTKRALRKAIAEGQA